MLLGKLLKRAAGRHAYRVHGFYKTQSRAIHIFQDARKKVAAAFSPFLCVCARIFYITRERLPVREPALVSPFQKISSFRAINFNLSRQSDAPKDCNMSPVMQKIQLHLLVICMCMTIFKCITRGEAAFNTVPLTTSDCQCNFHVKKFFNLILNNFP